MSEDTNEDSWLYGSENFDSKANEYNENEETENFESAENAENVVDEESSTKKDESIQDSHVNEQKPECIEDDPAIEMEEQEQSQLSLHMDEVETENLNGKNKGGDEEYTDDSDDDDINIVIGQIKSGPLYPKQRQNFIVPNVASQAEKKQVSGKFSIEEFESMGSINGVSIHEFSIDSLDEKPWRKPGADITDYFNYGFNEDTWRAYCERQKRIRINESGVGLQALTAALSGVPNPPVNSYNNQPQGQTPQVISSSGFMTNNRTLTPVSNTDKYNSGPPRSRGPFPPNQQLARENTIQVMTAECRDYSKTNFPGAHDDSFFDNDAYNYGFEPTQDVQWLNQVNKSWQPSGIKEVTLDPGLIGPSVDASNQIVEMEQHSMINIVPSSRMSPSAIMQRPIESMMLPPKVTPPFSSRDWNKDWEREKDSHFKDRERDMRSRDRDRIRENKDRDSDSVSRDRYDRDKSDRDWNRDRERNDDKKRSREKSRERNKEKSEELDRSEEAREKRRRDRERERERDRERSSRRDGSRSREKSKRRSKSHEKSNDRKEKRDKKKFKEKNGSE